MSQFFGCSLPDCCAILLTFRCTVLVTMLHSCYSLTPSSEMQSLSANLSLISSLRSIGGAQQENEAHLFTYDSRGSLLPGTPQGISSMQSKIRGILEEVMALLDDTDFSEDGTCQMEEQDSTVELPLAQPQEEATKGSK
jgi:hypothetical protein